VGTCTPTLPRCDSKSKYLLAFGFVVTDERALALLIEESGLANASVVIASCESEGAQVGWEPERPIYPASMIKLPIAAALALRCAAETLGWDDTVEVDPSNLTANDAPSPCVPGARLPLGLLMHEMLAASDNVATNVLIDVLGRDTIGPACAPLGLRSTAVRRKLSGSSPLVDDPAATGRNAHPAGDAARLLAAVANDAFAGARRIYDALRAQRWNDKLSQGLRSGDVFAHKTGDTSAVSHDGGILELAGGGRVIVVAYTELPSCPENDAKLAAFARALRPMLDRPPFSSRSNP